MNLWENVKYGLPLDGVRIIDVHGHFGEYSAFYNPGRGTPEQVVDALDRLGVESVIVSSLDAISVDFKRGNRQVLEAVEEFPGRIFGYVSINPNYQGDIIPELEKYIAHDAFKGIKVHQSFSGIMINSPLYAPVFEYADAHELPVLIHTWGIADILNVAGLADRYKRAKLIIAHSEVALKDVERMADAVNSRGNIYIDTAISGAPEGGIETLAAYVNTKRILYGSDIAFYSPNFTFGRIALSDVDDEVKLDIFGRNAAKLFGI